MNKRATLIGMFVISAIFLAVVTTSSRSGRVGRDAHAPPGSALRGIRDLDLDDAVHRLSPARTAMTSWEEAALSRSKELMGFTNPAIVDLVSVLDAHAPTGWLKTYALNDACMFSVLFSQIKDWQKEDQENEVTVLRQMKKSGADASILQGIEDARRRKESGDASLLIFYQNACRNHFAIHYGMTGADFIDKLKNVYYGQPRPVFGSN